MVGEDSAQTHRSGMEDRFAAEAAETRMAMHDFNLLPNHDIAEYGEEGKHGREGRFSVDHEERNVVDLEAIGEVSNSCPAFVCVGNDDHFMAAVDQFL